MSAKISEMLRQEIVRIERRVEQLRDAAKRHPEDPDLLAKVKVELAMLHTRLDELHDREKKYVVK